MSLPASSLCHTEWHKDNWQIGIYYNNLFSAYWPQPSCRLLTYFCKFFFCISVCSMWPQFLRVHSWSLCHIFVMTRWHTSVRANKFNFHLNLLGWFLCELHLCQETPRKSRKNSGQGWEAAKTCRNCDSTESGLTWCDCQNQCSRSPARLMQYGAWHHFASTRGSIKASLLPNVVSRSRSGAFANIGKTEWVRVLIKVLAYLTVVGHDNPKGDTPSVSAFSWNFSGSSVR
jgi:hypothetical protein